MPHFMLAYRRDRQPEPGEDGAEHRARWQAWIGGLGNAIVNPGTPLGTSRLVTRSGIGGDDAADPLMGFSVVAADNLDRALEMARSCPFLEMGTIEVAEMKTM